MYVCLCKIVVCVCVYACIFPTVCLCIYSSMSVYVSICLSVCLFINLSIFLSACLHHKCSLSLSPLPPFYSSYDDRILLLKEITEIYRKRVIETICGCVCACLCILVLVCTTDLSLCIYKYFVSPTVLVKI